MRGALILATVLAALSASAEGDEWSTPAFEAPAATAPAPEPAPPARVSSRTEPAAADPAPELPPFDASPVVVDPRLRVEVGLGLWMTEQASRLRASNPAASLRLTLRPRDRVRVDGGYRFTFMQQGSHSISALNTFHGLSARAHYAMAVGGSWFTLGGGAVGYLVTSSRTILGQSASNPPLLTGGAELAAAFETQVDGRLLRFELAAASRGLKVDLLGGVAVAF